MNAKYQSRLELFVDNIQAVKKGFAWKNTIVKRLAALLYAAESKAIDIEAVRACERQIKEHTGLFSSFRGNSSLTVSTLFALSDDPDKLLADTLAVYGLMKEARFLASDYLVIAACMVASHAVSVRFTQVVDRAKAFYDGMKQRHMFLTGEDDYIFAAMLGLSGVDVQSGVTRIDEIYHDLKPDFRLRNSMQTLAQVLMLGGENANLTARVRSLNEAFRAQGMKLDKEYTLSSLGVLSLLHQDLDSIVRNVQETFAYLRSQQGFGVWAITRQELLLLSAALVAFESADTLKKDILATAVSTTFANIIIAQQTAVVVAAASSAVIAASASAASG